MNGKIEGPSEESSPREAEKMDGESHENEGDGVAASVHGGAKTLEKIDEDGTSGEFWWEREVGQKAGKDEAEEKKKSAEGAEPRQGGGEGGEGRISAEAIGGTGKKEKGEAKEGGHPEDAIEQDGESGAGFLLREPAEEVKEAHGVAAGGADEKKIKEEADKSEVEGAKVGEGNILQAEEKEETSSAKEDGAKGNKKSRGQPKGVSGGEAVGEAEPVDLGGKEGENRGGEAKAEPWGEAA